MVKSDERFVQAERLGDKARLPDAVGQDRGGLFVDTIEGRRRVAIGEWVLTSHDGEHWPSTDAAFRAKYERVGDGLYREREGS